MFSLSQLLLNRWKKKKRIEQISKQKLLLLTNEMHKHEVNQSDVDPIDVNNQHSKFTCYSDQHRVCKSLIQHLRQAPKLHGRLFQLRQNFTIIASQERN